MTEVNKEELRRLAERLRELFCYSEKTGLFTRRIRTTNSVKEGDLAGWTRPDGYIGMRFDGRYYQAHRLAWLYLYCKWPDGQIDHINGIRSDNRISNLRDVCHAENGRNQKRGSTNKSGVNGVHWFKARNKWRAVISVDGRSRHIGYFETLEEAQSARKKADIDYGFHKNHGRIDATMTKECSAND